MGVPAATVVVDRDMVAAGVMVNVMVLEDAPCASCNWITAVPAAAMSDAGMVIGTLVAEIVPVVRLTALPDDGVHVTVEPAKKGPPVRLGVSVAVPAVTLV